MLTFFLLQWSDSMTSYRRVIGTLGKDDDHGSENVGKKCLRSFKLINIVYLDPRNMSNAGHFS